MNFWVDALPSVIAAVLLWWGATGIIIFLCGRKQWRPCVFGTVTLIQPLAFWQLWATRESNDAGGIFASFFWAVIIWSWVETSYYSGFIVGRVTPELEPDAPTGLRFRRAVSANLYHELMILGLSIAVLIVGWGGRNEVGLWAFMILHWSHQSAKINIFLGVNNLATEYLPDNLKYMAQYFAKKPLNSFFPFSVTISIIITTLLFNSIVAATSAGQQAGQAILFVMMSAAVLEHWWLVTPVPSKVWDWALKSRKTEETIVSPAPIQPVQTAPKPLLISENLPTVQIVCGYLGSGKTTLIRNLLPQLNERVAVIVNDFGSVGVDAELIRADGAAGAVVELPGGCVCCTLQKNLTGQIIKLLESYKPDRLIIEPSGVAGIEEIVRALASPRLVGRIGKMEVVSVMDATRLLEPGDLRNFTIAQLRAASAIVINKLDLIEPEQIAGLVDLVKAVNPLARCLTTTEGQVNAAQLLGFVSTVPETPEPEEHSQHDAHPDESAMISFGREYQGYFEPSTLKVVFERLAAGHFGPTVRAKGLFVTEGGRQNWNLAAGRVSCRLLPASSNPTATSQFMVIASDLAIEELNKQLEKGIINSSAFQPNARQERTDY